MVTMQTSPTTDHCTIGFHQHGFTLIELLLAITLSSLVVAAVYATFTTAIGSQQRIDRVASASQASRFFMERIRADIKNVVAASNAIEGGAKQLKLQVKAPDRRLAIVSYASENVHSTIVRREEQTESQA